MKTKKPKKTKEEWDIEVAAGRAIRTKSGGIITPFPPGRSGNPMGYRSDVAFIRQVFRDYLKGKEKGKTRLQHIVHGLYIRAKRGDVPAASLLLARGWGKCQDEEPNDQSVNVFIQSLATTQASPQTSELRGIPRLMAVIAEATGGQVSVLPASNGDEVFDAEFEQDEELSDAIDNQA